MTDAEKEHPIFNNSEFFIKTPMIKTLNDQVTQCLWNGISGAAIYGSYRIGKTRALEYLKNHYTNRLGEKIPSKSVSIAPRDFKTVVGVFKNICHSWKFNLKTRATADDMSNLILHHLGELAMSNSTRQVILVVDELQRLNVSQLEAFAELYDKLAGIGLNLFVLFIGNGSASSSLIKSLHENRNELIRGRFFTQEFNFYGIRISDELKACLNQYDCCKFPKGGATYTQFFLKNVVPSSWRLESLSDLIWSVYRDHYQIPLKLESLPMQYFVSMVRILLTDFIPEYGVDQGESLESMIIESFNVCGLVKNLVIKVSQ